MDTFVIENDRSRVAHDTPSNKVTYLKTQETSEPVHAIANIVAKEKKRRVNCDTFVSLRHTA